MKKITILLFTFCFLTTYAQRLVEGNLNVLKNEKTINVVFDYSNVVFRFDDSEEETRYVERKVIEEGEQWKTDWESKKAAIKAGIFLPEFIKEFNLELFENSCSLRGGNYDSAKYTMVVVIKVICSGRNAGPVSDDPYISATIFIRETATNQNIAKIEISKIEGSPFSDFSGRIESAFENVGNELGEYLAKKIK
jgi:hypothetical protein